MLDNLILNEYKRIIKNDNFKIISRLYCLSCVECSCKWLEIDQTTSEETKLEMSYIVYQYYLDTEIQISKISDIICEHWDEYLNNDDFDIYNYVDVY